MMMKCAVIVITINSNTLWQIHRKIARSNWGEGRSDIARGADSVL